MSSKFKMPARDADASRDVESWVAGDQKAAPAETAKPATRQSTEKLARLTIDLPQQLHGRFKAACALKGTRMGEEVAKFIEDWTQKNS